MSKNNNSFGGIIALAGAALIWGTGFVAQSIGLELVSPGTFLVVRSVLGSLTILPLALLSLRRTRRASGHTDMRATLGGGALCGVLMFAASYVQQYGIMRSTVAKSGFLTALYIVFVPVLGLFLRKRAGWNVWLAVAAATAGLWLLCAGDGFTLGAGDFYLLAAAVIFAVHILVIDKYTASADCLTLSLVQAAVSGVLAAVAASITGWSPLSAVWGARWSLLYSGVVSCGLAFSLQIVGQRTVSAFVSSLVLSFESVFAALAGWVLLSQTLSARELGGCALVFAALIVAQLPARKTRGSVESGCADGEIL